MGAGVILDEVDELVTNAGDGIGDCAGGFYRSMMNGTLSYSSCHWHRVRSELNYWIVELVLTLF